MEPMGEREVGLFDALTLIAAWHERIGPLDDDCAILGHIASAALAGETIPADKDITRWAWRRSRPDLPEEA